MNHTSFLCWQGKEKIKIFKKMGGVCDLDEDEVKDTYVSNRFSDFEA